MNTAFVSLYKRYINNSTEGNWTQLVGTHNITSSTFSSVTSTLTDIILGEAEPFIYYTTSDIENKDSSEEALHIYSEWAKGRNKSEVFLYSDELEFPESYKNDLGTGTDINGVYNVVTRDGTGSDENLNLARMLAIGTDSDSNEIVGSLVDKVAGVRYGNASEVRCEIRYGRDNSVYELVAVQIDYLKAPQFIRLTQEQVDLTKDTSQMMEFPDYVCQEIINELVHIVMENTGDPRLQTHAAISTSIASAAQQQTAASAE